MNEGRSFDTVAHESRGQSQSKYVGGQESPPRLVFGAAGVLVINIALLAKQLAFGPRLEEESSLEGDPLTKPAGSITDVARTPADSLLQQVSNHEDQPHSDPNNASRIAHHETPLSLLPLQPIPNLPRFHDTGSTTTSTVGHANDNAILRLPLTIEPAAAGVASLHDTGAGSASGPVSPSDGEITSDKPIAAHDKGNPGNDAPTQTGLNRNRAPVVSGPVHLGELSLAASIVIALTDLLANASDPDSDPLSVVNLQSSAGQLLAQAAGDWLFVPGPGDAGNVTFTYEVSDSTVSISQTAVLALVGYQPSWIFGTESHDTIIGTSHSDQISALAGNDVVRASDGADVVDVGGGDDFVFGDDGDDTIDAGDGNDIVFAGAGNDVVFGGSGDDIIFGESGDDQLFGGDGRDQLYGGAGSDKLDGGMGDDFIEGGLGNDVASGGSGNDTFKATAHAQLVTGLSSLARATGDGNQTANLEGAPTGPEGAIPEPFSSPLTPSKSVPLDDGDDVYDGGDGSDTVDVSSTSEDTLINLSSEFASGAEIGRDRLISIENVIAGQGNDTIVASGARNELTGGGGADTFVFLSSADTAPSQETWDRITDFEVGDRIDVSHIDANETAEGSQSFIWKGASDNFETVGELRYKHEVRDDGDHTLVLGNTNDDEIEDFVIDLDGWIELLPSDFVGVH